MTKQIIDNYEIDYQKKTPALDFENTIVNLNEKIKKPPIILSCGRNNYNNNPIKVMSEGNLSMIMGEEKSRKSFLKSLIEASIVGGRSNNYTNDLLVGHLNSDKYIFSIDTEQSAYDVWLNGKRVPEMAGGFPTVYKMFKWREKSIDERLELLHYLFMESEYKDELGFVMLDGFVDFIKDFNSQHECSEFIGLLMKYSSLTKCHISGVVHVNPNSQKSRGHLGTMLQQKCENVILVKDEGEFSSVKCRRSRGDMKFEDFTIRINNDWLPYISEDKIEDNLKTMFT